MVEEEEKKKKEEEEKKKKEEMEEKKEEEEVKLIFKFNLIFPSHRRWNSFALATARNIAGEYGTCRCFVGYYNEMLQLLVAIWY